MNKIKKIALIGVGSDGWIGGIYYIMNIINALDKTDNKIELHLFESSEQSFPDLSIFKNISVTKYNYTELFFPYTIWNKIYGRISKYIFNYKNPRIEKYLMRNNFDYVFPDRLSTHKGRLNVGSWIADFQHINYQNGSSKKNIKMANVMIKDIAINAKKIILSSKAVEKECHVFFPETKGKTYVMPFAVYINKKFIRNNLDNIKKKYSLPERFLIVSNLFAPTKNHKILFKAIGLLKKEGVVIPLFCTGNLVDSRNLKFPNEILAMLTKYNIRDVVHILGLIPREDQMALYRMTTSLVQPSFHEGWNTTVEEAKALGKNILLSNIPVHKEQMPLNNYLFNPLDVNDLVEKIKLLWNKTKNINFPDIENEEKSIRNYQKNVKGFGLKFLEIAKS